MGFSLKLLKIWNSYYAVRRVVPIKQCLINPHIYNHNNNIIRGYTVYIDRGGECKHVF